MLNCRFYLSNKNISRFWSSNTWLITHFILQRHDEKDLLQINLKLFMSIWFRVVNSDTYCHFDSVFMNLTACLHFFLPAPCCPSIYLCSAHSCSFSKQRDTPVLMMMMTTICVLVCVCVFRETGWQASSHPYRASQLFLCFDGADLCVYVCASVCGTLQMSLRWSFEHMAQKLKNQGGGSKMKRVKVYFTVHPFLWNMWTGESAVMTFLALFSPTSPWMLRFCPLTLYLSLLFLLLGSLWREDVQFEA